ncbi:serine/threonine-protein kinase [Nonomuraea ferruginea]|uniref:non-specific serine/threonine protein kinase n=1 Tax=Nonomuraea ferruginea TaxID=46174 RepID=A0ABT4SVT0_9ACTN|nr:PASTA domain-containing protein [Nonomuraea ferruginea]MDA0641000.1 PASTA domain-containing protein [Nonomuraea ferruginea]
MPTAQPLRTGDPRTLGPYELSGRLGEGGQGVVFLGTLAGESYAVKLLHGPVGDGRGAFLREVELAKHVARFCTAQVVDAGFDEGRPYIVSEYVDGPSLAREVMLTGPRRGGGLERLAVGTVTAIAAIHRAGIVHRDFKPQNVLLGPDGPRVIDFGLARALDAAATLSNRSVGTPAYMAPEQITASAVTGAVDVFSWGATICFAANGTAPFGQDSVAPVLHRILTAPPDLGSLEGPLRALVEACLDKDARNRPTSRDLLLELLGTSEGVPAEVLRSPPPHILRAVPPPRPPVADSRPVPLAEPETTGTPDDYHLPEPPAPSSSRPGDGGSGAPASAGGSRDDASPPAADGAGAGGSGREARPRLGGAAYRGSPAGYPVERVPREPAPPERVGTAPPGLPYSADSSGREAGPRVGTGGPSGREGGLRAGTAPPGPYSNESSGREVGSWVGTARPGPYSAESSGREAAPRVGTGGPYTAGPPGREGGSRVGTGGPGSPRWALGKAGLAVVGALLVTAAVLVSLFVPLFREDGMRVRAGTPTSGPTAEPSGQAADDQPAKERPPTEERPQDDRTPASKEPPVRKPVEIAVPALAGLSRAAAVRALERAGLAAGDITKADSPRKIGQVLASRPAVGTYVSKGSAVALEVSAGVKVPAVTGERREAAEAALTGAGLKVGKVSASCAAKPDGQVLSTAPEAGARVSGGTPVALVVARRGAPVPPVAGQSRDGALAALRAAGLVPVVRTQVVEDESQWNVAIAQDPAPGTCAEPGARVSIMVGARPPDGPDPTEPTPTPTPEPSTEP